MSNLKLDNVRCTIFIDKLIPFSKTSKKIQELLGNNNGIPILYPPINIFPPINNIQYTNWGLQIENKPFLEIHDNKIDYFIYSDGDFGKICGDFLKFVKGIIKEYGLRIRRLAFAPTYTMGKEYINDFLAANIKNDKFKNASIHDFNMTKVYYLNETIDDVVFNMIYNANIFTQPQTPFESSNNNRLLVAIDINTKDTGNVFYNENESILFYENVTKFNTEFLKNLDLEV